MCERYRDQLPLIHPQLGTWPATQACALCRNQTGAQPTEPLQPGQEAFFFRNSLFVLTRTGSGRLAKIDWVIYLLNRRKLLKLVIQ